MNTIKVAHVTTIDFTIKFMLLNQLLSLKEEGYDVTAICRPGPYVSDIESAGIRVLPVKMTRNVTPFADLRSLYELYQTFLREKFTIVHTHTPKVGLLGQLAAKFAGVPVIVNTVHGFYFHDNMSPFLRRFYINMEKIAALNSGVILSQNSEDIQTAIRERICKPDIIKYLGNGINVIEFNSVSITNDMINQKRAELGIPENVKVVGFVGRLVKEKGILELLAAIQKVKTFYPDVKLLIIGPIDHDKPDVLTPDIARQYGGSENCLFTGLRYDMPELYSIMDVFVLPSHREGFPRSPMEASAMGIPVIATDIRGCREAVKHGCNGLLVPLGDVNALADAILDLLNNSNKAQEMSKEGRRMAEEFFDEQIIFQRVKDEYVRLLATKGLTDFDKWR